MARSRSNSAVTSSAMRKRGSTPASSARSRNTRPRNVCTVEIGANSTWRARSASPRSASASRMRSFISRAALLVNVTARMRRRSTPLSSTRCRYRSVSTRVLPVPAPATTATAEPAAWTAALCSSVSFKRRPLSPPARPARNAGTSGSAPRGKDRNPRTACACTGRDRRDGPRAGRHESSRRGPSRVAP